MRRFCIATAVALIAAVSGCGDEDPVSPPVPARSVTAIFEHPFPPTRIHDIWGASATDIHAVGSRGQLLHYDGQEWSLVESPTREWLNGVWGLSAHNIVAVGENGTILRYNGERWTLEESGTTNPLNDVWGSHEDTLFAVGYDPDADNVATVFRYDGRTWKPMPALTPFSRFGQRIWGTSRDNFYVGTKSVLYRFNGVQWNFVHSLVLGTHAITGTSPDDIWVADVSTEALHYDGSSWTRSPGTTTVVNGIWAVAKDNVFACLYGGGVAHFDGTSWTGQTIGDDLHAFESVWASGDTDAWVVGTIGSEAGVIYQFDGSQWQPSSKTLVPFGLNAIWSNASGDHAVAVGSRGIILEKTGDTWHSIDGLTSEHLKAAWGAPTGEIFIATQEDVVWTFINGSWDPVDLGAGLLTSIWGTSKSNVYLGSHDTGLWHYDGNKWSQTLINDNVRSIWGTSTSNVLVAGRYASGLGGVVRRFDGEKWIRIFFQPGWTESVIDITGYENGELFAKVFDVNGNTSLQHFDGKEWRNIMPPQFNRIFSVGANQDVGLIVSGTHYDPQEPQVTEVLLYDGMKWQALDPQYETSFVDAWGGLDGAIYMLGSTAIARFED